MDNNIRALALAEWLHGAGRHLTDFLCVGVRSGIGAGLVIDGKLLRGSHGFAGEIGYAPVPRQGPMAQWRALQQLVGEAALDVDTETESWALSSTRARRAGELLGGYLAALASTFDPQAVILAGTLVQADGPLFRHVARAFRRHLLPDIVDRVTLVPSVLGPHAAALGMTHVCFNEAHPEM
jgi:predicted NBD/HSP70 family sugar kinase